jgi:hypothetical protein
MEFGHLEEVGRARLLPQNGKLGAGLTARLLAPLRFARTQAGLLRRRASMEKDEAPPRPGSALRDKTGRRMVYGNPSFRFAQIVSASAAWALHGRCMGAAWALHGLCIGSQPAMLMRWRARRKRRRRREKTQRMTTMAACGGACRMASAPKSTQSPSPGKVVVHTGASKHACSDPGRRGLVSGSIG